MFMQTKEFFRRYINLKNELIQMEASVRKLKKISIVDMDDNEKLKPGLEEIINRYNSHIEEIISERIRIEDLISMLEDPLERAVMRYKYIEGFTWNEICRKISYEWTTVHRIHRSALNHIEKYISPGAGISSKIS